ncbi:MAG TPA: glycosidase [Phycisphaerales bacterium]|nr:glycosidase [Phycisphaerales bacterium]
MVVTRRNRFVKRHNHDIVYRWEGNPLISICDLPFKCSDIHNAGAVSFRDETLLLVTIEHLAGQRSIHLSRPDKDGYYQVDSDPFLGPSTESKYKQHESHGVLDARVTFLDGIYYIMYNSLGHHGFRLALARTEDFKSVERMGLISEPDTKAGALFPAKIKGRYARLERPCHGNSIWITYSDDLVYWGGSELVISPREEFWDANRIGVGAPPIELEQGWLVLYYGVKTTSAGPIYRIGTVILDKQEPTVVMERANIPILSPRENYERIGDVPNVVFPTGAVIDSDGYLDIFYGASDSCICVGTTTVEEIIKNCVESKKGY